MFFVGLYSSFIPYLLLSLTTLICYWHDHQAASDKVETRISSSLVEISETYGPTEVTQETQQAIEQVQSSGLLDLFKKISASIFPYTGLPISSITTHHPLRAPPGIRISK